MARRVRSKKPASAPDGGEEILQFKIWLIGLSPMVWRRVEVHESMSLRELHGVFQVIMGWEGIHLFEFNLRACRYGSSELNADNPDFPLADLKLRIGARFVYQYDLNIPWEHEVRLEARLPGTSKKSYPHCVDGHENCPPEDCGGITRFLDTRNERWSWEGTEDVGKMADFVKRVVLENKSELLTNPDYVEEMQDVLERIKIRQEWEGVPFSLQEVNDRLIAGDHLDLMHQQW